MTRMSTAERLEDISKRSGVSVDVVRRVLDAERDSIIDSIKKGESAILIGRAIITPEMRYRVGINLEEQKFIRLKYKPTESFKRALDDTSQFQEYLEEDKGIKLRKIPSLI